MADFADRSLGIGYAGGTLVLFVLLISSISIWYWSLGSVEVGTVSSPKTEMFYWVTIMFSQTLGTALGDWTSNTLELGYKGGGILFGILLAIVAATYYWTHISRTLLFWAAFILTRPLGAVLGDFLDKPLDDGGLALSRYEASAVLVVFIVACTLIFPQRAAIYSAPRESQKGGLILNLDQKGAYGVGICKIKKVGPHDSLTLSEPSYH